MCIIALGLECEMDYTKSKKSEPEIDSRIRESEDSCQVKAHSKPWVVRLNVADKKFCGGTLIGTKTVVTAAHCMCEGSLLDGDLNCNELWKNTTLIIGDHERTTTDCSDKMEKEQCFGVEYVNVHKNWTGNIYFSIFTQSYLNVTKNAILRSLIKSVFLN